MLVKVVVWILPISYSSDVEGVFTVAVDYNNSTLAKRVDIARSKRRIGDATPENRMCVIIRRLRARSERMGLLV